jgi:hypothetical protein
VRGGYRAYLQRFKNCTIAILFHALKTLGRDTDPEALVIDFMLEVSGIGNGFLRSSVTPWFKKS